MLVGLFAGTALAAHGATFLSWRTDGDVRRRARRIAVAAVIAVAALWPVVTWATVRVNLTFFGAFAARPPAWLAALVAWGGLGLAFAAARRGKDLAAFLGSCAFLAGMLAATAACLWPVLLRSAPDPSLSITARGSAVTGSSLRIALAWVLPGLALAAAYLAFLFRWHRGTAVAARDGEGY